MDRISGIFHKAVLAAALVSIAAASGAAVDPCGFEKVPREALVELKEVRGKPFVGGAVFVRGHLIPSPYTVSRYGTSLVVNGKQVSGQVVPWSRFTGEKPSAVPAAPRRPSPRRVKARRIEKEDSLDDLFGEDGDAIAMDDTPPQTAPEQPAKPFRHTRQTRALLDGLNAQRANLDRSLRQQKFFFFSPSHPSVGGNFQTLCKMMETLPEALRDSVSPQDLLFRMRKAGIGFLTQDICNELFMNKRDFDELLELRARLREEAESRKTLTQGMTF